MNPMSSTDMLAFKPDIFPNIAHISQQTKKTTNNTHTHSQTHVHTLSRTHARLTINAMPLISCMRSGEHSQQRRTFHSGTLELIQSFVLASLDATSARAIGRVSAAAYSHMVQISDPPG